LRPSSYEVDAGYFNELDARGLPIVMIDVELKNIKMPFCGTDDYTGGRLAAEHLLELGHRVLGHVAGSPQATTAIRRKQGFLDAVAACPGARAVVCPHESFDADDAAIEAFLAKERPSAVFAANDELASHVCKVAELFGLRIPSELSIIGFANLSFSKMLTPPLSSFDQRPELIAENAVELLFSLMEERKGGKPSDDSLGERRLVQPEPVLRASTSAFIPS
jgi:LacI family transcriptional regulator